jgi:hypothetical protein
MRCKKCIAWPFTQLVHTILDDEDKAVLTLDLEGVANSNRRNWCPVWLALVSIGRARLPLISFL